MNPSVLSTTRPTSSRDRRRPRATHRLRFQKLEDRQLLAGDILVAAIDSPPESELNHGTLSLIDVADREVSPVVPTTPLQQIGGEFAEGVTGLAFTSAGALVASVDTDTGSDILLRPSVLLASGSRVPAQASGQPVHLGDLAALPGSADVIGITGPSDMRFGPGRLVTVNPVNGNVGLLGDTGLREHLSIAADANGAVFVVSQTSGLRPPTLHQIDPADGSILSSMEIIDANPIAFTTGLTADPDSGLLYGAESHLGRFFTIDPATGERMLVDTQPPERGVTGDIAFHPRLMTGDVTQIFHADFEVGNHGFTIDNDGGDITGFWHLSLGRHLDEQLNHSPNNAFYYGRFEDPRGGGHYIVDAHHRGVISSPEIALPTDGTSVLSFSYLLDTRPEVNRDFVTVYVDDGSTRVAVRDRASGTLIESRGDWITATVDLSAFAGETITVDFEFDSGDPVRIDPEGWYVDDVVIVHVADLSPNEVDLGVEKIADDDVFQPGIELNYEITVTNDASSPTAATDVIVVDPLSPDVVFVSASDDGVYDPDEHTVTWTISEIAANAMMDLQLVVQPNLASTVGEWACDDRVNNVVRVSANQLDTNPDNNADQVSVPIACVDLAVNKEGPDSVISGTAFAYTLDVANLSSRDATHVVVEDTLPDGITFDPAGSTPGFTVVDPGTVRWLLPVLEAGQRETLTLNVIAGLPNGVGFPGQVTNTVAVTSDQLDSDPDNNQDDEQTLVGDVNLSVTKLASETVVSHDSELTYTIQVANAAESVTSATGVTVIDTLPLGASIVSISPNGAVSPDPRDPERPQSIEWALAPIAPGDTRTLTVVARIDANDDPLNCMDEVLRNEVAVSANEFDANTDNNTAFVETGLVCDAVADLGITKTADEANPLPGSLLLYELSVTNQVVSGNRGFMATGVSVVDTLPDGVTFVSSTPPAQQDGQALTWDLGSLEAGASANIQIAVTVNDATGGQVIVNRAEVTSETPELDPSDNTVTLSTAPLQTVQFITPLNVFRVSGPLAISDDVSITTPAPGLANVSGFVWNDVDQDGVWDTNELPRPGQIVFLDVDGDGELTIADPITEPAAVTDRSGQYLISDVSPGTYPLLLDVGQEAGGVASTQTFGGEVTLVADQSLIGTTDLAESPNLGLFQYSPLIRPADEYTDLVDEMPDDSLFDASLRDQAQRYRVATDAFQRFQVVAPADADRRITAIDKQVSSIGLFDNIAADVLGGATAADYVHVYTVDPNDSNLLTEISAADLPINVPAGTTQEFFLIYDPAIRDPESANGVRVQSPQWFGETTPTHTFVESDRIVVRVEDVGATETTLAELPVRLVGASTFDSDIFYDGQVDNRDLDRLQNLLDDAAGELGEGDPLFDRTSDVNAICQNGTGELVGVCDWDGDDTAPRRSIDLGDYGPMNVEVAGVITEGIGFRRQMILDLDASDSAGIDSSLGLISSSSQIVQDDMKLFAADNRELPILTVKLLDAAGADRFEVPADPAIVPSDSVDGPQLVIDLSSVPDPATTLRSIVFVPDTSIRDSIRKVTIQSALASDPKADSTTPPIVAEAHAWIQPVDSALRESGSSTRGSGEQVARDEVFATSLLF
ncbi:MAG: hypothetical protein AAGD07_07145 [Planctomycetota bacterium]